ncbi:T9SS type A sorting domain-containing protein [Polaribacter sp. MSW13]|uniref:T9SS type A sorting domain-containing protein n=1 Tax=Polaribacter marinus TaxID=2916838 RepID=A0A9X1VNK4_9FLAO|nr:LamG-like jellyroll fold domain-containing protein [Polaribacter marinus]MCI2229819.1 T9SS type A sorting domain-containing protein [Polaribacter marinus]
MKTKLQIVLIFTFLTSVWAHAQTDYSLSYNLSRVEHVNDGALDALNGATDYTIEAWVKPTSATNYSGRVVLKREGQFALTLFNSNRFYFTHYSGALGTTKKFVNTSTNVININEWNHIAVVCNSITNTIKLYANGVNVTSGTQSALTLSSTSIGDFIVGYGGLNSGATSLYANVDKVRIKTTAETIASLQSNITDAAYTTDADTVVLLNFNEGTGITTVNEASGLSFDLTGTNLPTWAELDHIWDGSVDADWATAGNWDTNAVPTAAYNVIIPEVTNAPIISGTTAAVAKDLSITETDGITINSGGSLIKNGTASGNITYNVDVEDEKWYLISSPVFNETYNDTWVTNNGIESGTGNNKGIATYQNGEADPTTGQWVYLQAGGSGTFGQGVGYSLKRTAAGSYAFTGEFAYNTKTPAISIGDNNWNLIGNPYASYLDIAKFIKENTETNYNLSDAYNSVYTWDPNSGTTGAYIALTEGFISPGQAFFVHSKVANGTASITEAMQSNGIEEGSLRSTVTSINLNLTNGTSTKNTKINYTAGTTTSLDPGFDIGMFNGVASDLRIYTELLNNNEGISFSRQTLPNSDYENMVVPVGVKAANGQTLRFTAAAMNLPSDIKVFLEDRDNNTFTRLDEANSEYAVTLTESLNGIGRFYIHTTPSVLSVNETNLENISIYKSDVSTLKIVGLQGKTTMSLFNVLGKQVLKTSFSSNGVKEITLPKVASGVYIIQLETEKGKLNQKIILE